jgi:hypothetical protein
MRYPLHDHIPILDRIDRAPIPLAYTEHAYPPYQGSNPGVRRERIRRDTLQPLKQALADRTRRGRELPGDPRGDNQRQATYSLLASKASSVGNLVPGGLSGLRKTRTLSFCGFRFV